MASYAKSIAPSYSEEQARHNYPEEAPPPYEDVRNDAPPPLNHEQQTRPTDEKSGHGESLPPIAQASSSAPGPSNINRQFPPSFNIYLSSNILYQKRYALGQHKDRPLNAISVHTGLSGNPDVILRTGTSSDSAPLATVLFKTFSSDMILTLPPLTPSQPPSEIRMVAASWPTRSWSFVVEVTRPDGGHQPEPFEWRHSSGGEVKSLSGWGTGWKLVHTGPGGQGTGSGPRSGEGNEVVAVFAVPAMSITKAVEFRFLGSGMTGQFGERWAVTAVISALGIWEKEKRRNAGSATS
ncbi:hypothetical protein DL546_006765 [Coniochaeta pulveracea]|uniref:Uncharacterized protein n=1 Tax=Coniochaeta pulveracea TaxID=177199 RepID=A0A420YA63_9PEZI|nr:hypothetical protein DL546_006765 [Coniochaeta pulveracea]